VGLRAERSSAAVLTGEGSALSTWHPRYVATIKIVFRGICVLDSHYSAGPMLQIIALTQFVFLALGSMGVTVLLKASGYPIGSPKDYPQLSLFLVQNSVWLLLIPIFWSAYAYASLKLERGVVSSKFAIPVGIALTAFIFATYAFAIVGHF
jgi:hypothetical protein